MATQCPFRRSLFFPRLTYQTLDMLEFVSNSSMVAAHGLGLEPSGGVLLLGLRIRVAELAAEPGKRGMMSFRGEIAFVPVGMDLVTRAMPVEQGE